MPTVNESTKVWDILVRTGHWTLAEHRNLVLAMLTGRKKSVS